MKARHCCRDSHKGVVRKLSKSYTVVADIVFVTSWFKCPLVEKWKISWYGAPISFHVARVHFCGREQYYQHTKHGAQDYGSHGDVSQIGRNLKTTTTTTTTTKNI